MSCLLVHIESPNQALRLLQQVRNQISFSDVLSKSSAGRLNLGLTWEGLHRLDGEVLTKGAELFKREFREGMVTPHRQKILGDLSHSPSAPSNWFWGQGETKKVHLALLIYELTAEKRDARVNEILESPGIDLVDHGRIDSAQLKNGKEHFGFRDGISQPWLKELNSPGAISDEVAWGEIVLGYQDNSGVIERHPEIALNGSYLVVRQIEQDVEGFWKSVGGVNGDPIAVAAKQWEDGQTEPRSRWNQTAPKTGPRTILIFYRTNKVSSVPLEHTFDGAILEKEPSAQLERKIVIEFYEGGALTGLLRLLNFFLPRCDQMFPLTIDTTANRVVCYLCA